MRGVRHEAERPGAGSARVDQNRPRAAAAMRGPWSRGIAAIVLGLLAAGCTTSSWQAVDLPATPTELATAGDTLLVGTDGRAGEPAGLLSLGPDGHVQPVGVTPGSPYGREGRWSTLAAADRTVVGLAGVRGGAHGNVRWTIWRGAPDGLTEQPQAFETFGGYGMGSLTGFAVTPAGPLLVGSWQSAAAGLEPALWRPDGPTWVRRPTPAPLANTTTELHRVAAVASSAATTMLVGTVTRLGSSLSVAPAAWVDAGRGWRQLTLPAAGTDASAEAVGCGPAGCLILGRSGSTLLAWWVQGEVVRALPTDLALADGPLPNPVLEGARAWALVPTSSGSTLLAWSDGWTSRPGPTGSPRALAWTPRALWAIAGGRLWRLDR